MTLSAREQKKNLRRRMQSSKVEAKANEDANYFWECVQHEQKSKTVGKVGKPLYATDNQLFEQQGTSGINFDQYDAIPVSRSGPPSKDIPEIENFLDLQSIVPPFLHMNLTHPDRMNYTTPTPIQRHCVPLSLSGKYDVMACAQTGSGKTVAFLVPLIAHIACCPSGSALATEIHNSAVAGCNSHNTSRVTPAAPIALIVAPTRELALQIELETHKLSYSSPLRCVCVYGGSPTRSQLALLAKGVDILVATPGRLNDFLRRELITLRHTRFLVLDEADRMLDMGFEPQIRQICETYDLPVAAARRTLMFSATFPDEVQRIAQKYMRSYVFVAVGRVGSTIDSISQRLVMAPANDKRSKLALLLPLINPAERTLVFCQKKYVAQWLRGQITRELEQAGQRVRVDAIHGDRSQGQREAALKGFREGSVDVLVATDVAARGLDVPEISHVIQFDLPVSKEDFDNYVHRIGRTGRAGRLGVATSLFVPGQNAKAGQNGALWAPLHALLVEGKQDIPAWFLCAGGLAGGNSTMSGHDTSLEQNRGLITINEKSSEIRTGDRMGQDIPSPLNQKKQTQAQPQKDVRTASSRKRRKSSGRTVSAHASPPAAAVAAEPSSVRNQSSPLPPSPPPRHVEKAVAQHQQRSQGRQSVGNKRKGKKSDTTALSPAALAPGVGGAEAVAPDHRDGRNSPREDGVGTAANMGKGGGGRTVPSTAESSPSSQPVPATAATVAELTGHEARRQHSPTATLSGNSVGAAVSVKRLRRRGRQHRT